MSHVYFVRHKVSKELYQPKVHTRLGYAKSSIQNHKLRDYEVAEFDLSTLSPTRVVTPLIQESSPYSKYCWADKLLLEEPSTSKRDNLLTQVIAKLKAVPYADENIEYWSSGNFDDAWEWGQGVGAYDLAQDLLAILEENVNAD